MTAKKINIDWEEIEKRFHCNKFQYISNNLKEKLGIDESTTLSNETKEIYMIFHKYGYDLSTPGDANYYLITDAMADDLLKCDTRNRKKYKRNVDGIIGDILHDDFHLDKDAVAFSKDGNILSGAQRLTAIKKSGVPVVLLVLTVFIDPFVQMDTGQKRDFGDNQRIKGNNLDTKIFTIINTAKAYAETCKNVKIADRGEQKIKDMIYEVYEDPLNEWLEAKISYNKKRWMAYSTFCFLLNGENERLVQEFAKMATRKIPVTYVPLNKLEAFMLAYNRLMSTLPNEGIYMHRYIDLAKYSFEVFKKYYSNRDRCIKFGYEQVPDEKRFRRAGHISKDKKNDLQLDGYKQKWTIDLSFLEA